MTRYFTRPKSYWDEEDPMTDASPTITVHESGNRETGLLDAGGNPIFASESIPMGFLSERK